MLKHTKGNLIDLAEQGEFDIIVHGCNCQNTMGSGIAKEIRERYPQTYTADSKFEVPWYGFKPAQIFKLGNFSDADVSRDKLYGSQNFFTIINAYTQVHYQPRGIDHFEYESFAVILRKLAVVFFDKHFGFPMIGMGLAGGDKDRIIAMLEDFAYKISATGGSVTLVEFSG
jgi:O-acetyl-ADP-ribose deacetylase (regulator of RNase III)